MDKKFTIQLRESYVVGDEGVWWPYGPHPLFGSVTNGWWEGHHPFVLVTTRRGRVVVSANPRWNIPEEFLRKIQREFALDWKLAVSKYVTR